MRKWNLPLTYEPKIAAVRSGECTQTIRPVTISKSKKHLGLVIRKNVGDLIRFYCWTGKPYRSKRETITEYMKITVADSIKISSFGFFWPDPPANCPWNDSYMDSLALRDGIVPATGIALRDVLVSKNGPILAEGIEAQILRWLP